MIMEVGKSQDLQSESATGDPGELAPAQDWQAQEEGRANVSVHVQRQKKLTSQLEGL